MDRAALSARSWAERWARGWATHDVELIGSLYAPSALFVSEPFRDHQDPAAYAAWAFADEAAAELWFARPLAAGDEAAVAWWAISTGRDGVATTLAGVSLLEFDGDGLVVRQRDCWNAAVGRALPPPDGWGPVQAHEATPGAA